MGSQIFDYWKDPFGNELEHWTDGDLFTAADPPRPANHAGAAGGAMGRAAPDVWGKMAPPPGLVAYLTALQLRIKRLFARSPKEA